MREDDLRLRALFRTFQTLDQSRRALAKRGDDHTELSAQSLAIAHQMVALRASTRTGLLAKARVMLVIVEATGATGPAIDIARSLAADLDDPACRPY